MQLRPNPPRNRLRPSRLLLDLRRLLAQASGEWIKDNVPRLGAAVAFYTLLSLAPVIVIAVAAVSLVYGQADAQGRLASVIRVAAGPDVARTIQEILRSADQPRTGMIATLLGLLTLLFGASSAFVELHDAMNTIWKVTLPPDRNNADMFIRLIRDRFYSFATVLGLGFALLVSLMLYAWLEAVRIAVPRVTTFTISYFVVAVLFGVLYKIVPDIKLGWSDVAPAAIITALLFMFGKQVIELYFANARFGSAYSAAGSPIVVLLWVYSSALLFFWGAEFTKVYTNSIGSQGDQQH